MNPSPWTPLHTKLHHCLRQKKILKHGEPLLIAVSGGQDSLCLLKLLLDLQPKWKWQLAIAHCDHRWSSDLGISDHVKQIADNWRLNFYLKVAQTPIAETEAAARTWRYQALTEIAQEEGFKCLLTAHTQSDRAETLLYNLMRGAGADGLGALDWQRNLREDLRLVRPLLNVSRRETEEFCREKQLPVWQDLANTNFKYARNRIRGELIPYLIQNFNLEVESHLAQTAEILREDVKYLQDCAENILKQAISPAEQGLNRLVLTQAPLALQRRVIRLFLSKKLNKSPNFQQIEAVTQLINAPSHTSTSTLPGGIIAQVEGNLIIFSQ